MIINYLGFGSHGNLVLRLGRGIDETRELNYLNVRRAVGPVVAPADDDVAAGVWMTVVAEIAALEFKFDEDALPAFVTPTNGPAWYMGPHTRCTPWWMPMPKPWQNTAAAVPASSSGSPSGSGRRTPLGCPVVPDVYIITVPGLRAGWGPGGARPMSSRELIAPRHQTFERVVVGADQAQDERLGHRSSPITVALR